MEGFAIWNFWIRRGCRKCVSIYCELQSASVGTAGSPHAASITTAARSPKATFGVATGIHLTNFKIVRMFRYDAYYGYWSSESDSEGDDSRYRPNKGAGGRDEGYIPADGATVPPPGLTATMTDTTPAVMTLNETDEFNSVTYKPAGQFTEARAMPLHSCNASKNGTTILATTRNGRPEYNYNEMTNETFRFPYYVPPGADLATLPDPIISIESSLRCNAGFESFANFFVSGYNTDGSIAPETNLVVGVPAGQGGPNTFSSGTVNVTLSGTQKLSFTPGTFNDFLFRIRIPASQLLETDANRHLSWLVSNIKTSLPTGYSFEFKKQQNWESYFNIKVVKNTDRTIQAVSSTPTTVTVTPEPVGNGWTLSSSWTWNSYDTANGFRHWEIPVQKFAGNKTFSWPITVFPENDDFCSMETNVKPAPQAPWNLVSRHESFWYAQHKMRVSDYAQDISPTATFYMPHNWRGIVWLKPGIAINDIL